MVLLVFKPQKAPILGRLVEKWTADGRNDDLIVKL